MRSDQADDVLCLILLQPALAFFIFHSSLKRTQRKKIQSLNGGGMEITVKKKKEFLVVVRPLIIFWHLVVLNNVSFRINNR